MSHDLTSREDERTPALEKAGGGLVFWLLVFMGMAAFAPCVLLPEWRAVEALSIAEQAEQHRTDALQRQVDREKRILEAMHGDPAVLGRWAQRDLGFRRPEEQAVTVAVAEVIEEEEQPFVAKVPSPPEFMASLIRHLPDYPYDRIFCDSDTRPMVMGLSVALIAVAFALFGRQRSGNPSVE